MLEKSNQMEAYKALVAAGGLMVPASVSMCRNISSSTSALATSMAALVLPTISYPSSVASMVSGISGAATTLTSWGTSAKNHGDLLSANADLSALLQLNTGWDIHCRANELAATELPISAAIGDADTAGAVMAGVSTLDLASLSEAMRDINSTLAAAPTDPTGVGGAPAPSLTLAQISALTAAWGDYSSKQNSIAPAISALKAQTAAASASVNVANAAFSDALSTVLAGSSAGNAATASAVSALVPAEVLSLLKEPS